MKLSNNLQRLVHQAFGEDAHVQHRRYGPAGEKREGYWLCLPSLGQQRWYYIGYSRQNAECYLQSVIEDAAV